MHWECFAEVPLKPFRTNFNDEVPGCAFIDAHHYQHAHTEVHQGSGLRRGVGSTGKTSVLFYLDRMFYLDLD